MSRWKWVSKSAGLGSASARVLAGLLLLCVSVGQARAQTNPDCEGSSCPPPYEQVVLQEGTQWQLLGITGVTADDPNPKEYKAKIFAIRDEKGLANVPLPSQIVSDLSTMLNAEATTTFFVHQQIAQEIAISEQKGELTPALKELVQAQGLTQGMRTFGDGCPNEALVMSKTFTHNTTVSKTEPLDGGFSGTLSLGIGIGASGTGEVHLQTKRYGIFGVCIPYAVSFNNARVYGGMTLEDSASLTGTLSYTSAWRSGELINPTLFSIDFMAGPIPVHIPVSLPVMVGMDLQASVTGNINLQATHRLTASFDYTCTVDGCTGGASTSTSSAPPPQKLTAGVTGRVQPSVWAQAAVRVSLYDGSVAHAQVGLRPYLRGDLWGYYGNACGDANGDGVMETVDALTFDLDWQLYITARAGALGVNKEWNDLWHSNRNHLGFWDLIGSEALQPMLGGPATAQTHVQQSYTVKMRPCWPYADTVSYAIHWGDAPTHATSGAPQTAKVVSHAWSTAGTKALLLTAKTDTHGRSIGKSISRSVTVSDSAQPPPGSHSYSYSATNTDFGSQNTVNRVVTLAAGQTLTVGTCGVPGATGTGDTYLRLSGPVGSVVAVDDDSCGLLSRITYTVPPGGGGSYTIMAGCYGSGSCTGTVTWTVSGAFFYSATATNSATTNTTNVGVALIEGETINVGTCSVPGSSGSGDTYLRLHNAASTQVAANDQACGGNLSNFQYTVPAGQSGTHQIRAGCWLQYACEGTVAYVISGP